LTKTQKATAKKASNLGKIKQNSFII